MIDRLTQLCEDASHPDDIRELLDDVMAFHDKALEVKLQLEEALTGEKRDQEATQWEALTERIQMARREVRARIRQMEGALFDCSARSNDLDHCSNSKPRVKERLREPKMPVFSGKVLEFPAFWDHFQGCVHNRTDLNDASKFSYLLSSLSGEALAAVEGMPSSSANYSHAMELLQVRFGRTDFIVREHVKAIWNAKPCSDSRDSIQAMVDEINRHLRCLTALGKNPSTGEMTAIEAFLPLLAEKFPEEIRLAWDVHVQSVSGRVSQFRSSPGGSEACSGCFIRRTRTRQAGRPEAARTRSRSSRAAANSSNGETGGKGRHNGPTRSCPICKGDHDVASCEEFLQADTHTRSRMAARSKLCFRCLQNGHRTKACKVGWKCTVSGCGGSHHRLLHRSQWPLEDQTRPLMVALSKSASKACVRMRLARMVSACSSNASSTCAPKAPSLGRMWPTLRGLLVRMNYQPGNCRQRWGNRAPDASGQIPSGSGQPIPAENSIPDTRASPAQDLRKDSTNAREAERMATLFQSSGCRPVLVGGDLRRSPAGGLVAIHSQLGWILCGQTSRRSTTAVTAPPDSPIGIATDDHTAPADEEALAKFEEGLPFDGERYEVRLPWLPSRPSLPNNFPQAMRRLFAVERRLARCEEENREYAVTMRQYVENVPTYAVQSVSFEPIRHLTLTV
ncbi:hypothetical protein T01_2128 [Trichinella spiralis]|uniref:CCHC-type domain-containing protein n=1 Tax=Trichinella spiralis TaxID=6334 RepID=A0A0V1BPE3_TRISP|nr:hypothetical protein T01_2128 [Trichinella spiralis]